MPSVLSVTKAEVGLGTQSSSPVWRAGTQLQLLQYFLLVPHEQGAAARYSEEGCGCPSWHCPPLLKHLPLAFDK